MADGSYYEGDWCNNKKHGKGKYHKVDKSVIDAHWENGRVHGEGTYIYANGTVV
jgi:hypothetical protein